MYYIEGTSIVFPTIQEARLYDFNINGNIDSVRSGTPEGWDGTVSSWDGENLTTVSDSGDAESTDSTTSTATGGAFTGTTYDEFLAWYPTSALRDQMISWYEAKGWEYEDAPSPGYARNAEGRYVDDNGNPLYYYTGTLVDQERRSGDYADYVSEDKIRADFNEDKGLQAMFGSWDKYWAYITDRQDLIDQGVIMDPWERDSQLWDERVVQAVGSKGGPNSLAITAVIQEEAERRLNEDMEAETALRFQYDIPQFREESDGTLYRWNGSGWTLIDEPRDLTLRTAALVIGGVLLGPAVGQALGTAMGVSSGTLTNAALRSIGTQLLTTGSVDPASLLQSVATAGLSEYLTNTLGPALSESFPDLADSLSTGSEAVDNVLKSMALDIARQGILTGEIDFQQTVQSGLFTAAGELLEWINDNRAISAEEQAAWEARIQAQTDAQHQEMFDEIERQFGEGALQNALNSMGAELAERVSQTLADMFAANNIVQNDEGTWGSVDDEGNFVEPTQDTSTGGGIDDGGPAEIDNPFEGDELINGVYYNEAGHPVGIHPDATKEQILEQFVNDKNAWTTASGVSAHGLPDDALAILIGDGDLQGLSDFLVANDLILAQEASGSYILISGASNITTGFHSSLDQDALLNLGSPSNTTFLPPPTSNPNLEDMDTSDVSEEVRDLLTNIEEEPQVEWETWQPPETEYTWEDIETTPLDQTEVEELEQFVEDFVNENPDATVADVLAGAQAAGATSASELAAIASAMTSSAQEAYDALTQSGVSSAEAAAGLVSNGSWTAEEANSATGGGDTTTGGGDTTTGGGDTTTGGGTRPVDDNPETNPPLEGGGYANPTSNTAYQVGDRYFDNIADARAYDFETTGTIDNVSAYNPTESGGDTGGGDTTTGGGDTTTGGGDTTTGGGDTTTGGDSGDSSTGGADVDASALQEALQSLANSGDANAQAILDALAGSNSTLQDFFEAVQSGDAALEDLLGGIGSDTDTILEQLGALGLDTAALLEGRLETEGALRELLEGQSQLGETQQSILNALQEAAESGDANAQALLDAINNNSVSLDELAEGMASGNAEILELLGGIGIDTDALLEGQSQLSQTQQDILQALQNAAANGDANAQALLDAINNNSTSLEELANGLASGNAEIIGLLEGIGADTDALLGGQQDILQGQSELEQSILEQLQAAADAGNVQAQQMLDAIGGNEDLLNEILGAVGEGNETITGQLGQLGIDVSGLQDGINALLEGQGDILGGQEGLSGQLSGTQEAILGALTDGLADAAAQGNANAQRILDAIASGNSEVVNEIMGGVSAGEGNIINMLIEAGVDLDGLQQGINDILAGQGALSDQMGEGFGGIGDQLGEGFGQLGEGLEGLAAQGRGLGMGLLGGIMALGEGQKKAARKTTPIWKDFYSAPTPYGAEIFQSKYVGAPQQDNTKQNLDNLIARSLGQGNNKGMLS